MDADQNQISRKDFLRLSGLTALTLPAVRKVGRLGGHDLLSSPEMYGGFLVQNLSQDDPPIEVNDTRYERFDSTNVIFSRIMWDEDYIAQVESTAKVFQAGDPGYDHVDVALSAAANFCGGFEGTNSPLTGLHAGLLGLNPSVLTKPGVHYEGKWDHSHLAPEEVSAVVKKAALFLGASLVGIAPLNRRWIYSKAYDMMVGGSAPIEFTEVEAPDLPEGKVSLQKAGETIKEEMVKLEGSQIKKMVIEVLENTDPEMLPPDVPPIAMAKMLPAGQFKENISTFTRLPAAILDVFAKKLALDFEIADVDLGESARPRYLEDNTLAIPETMINVIVLAFEMDYDSIDAAPTIQGDIATMDGYSKMAVTAGAMAKFIRGLGYHAIPCGNNTGISVPQAIEAGLGEGGRNGILITPKYGPRVRLAKVITDLPMAKDQPIRFGVREFCQVCKKCADLCPTQAISYQGPTMEPTTISSNPGVKKWSVHAEKCYLGWTANGSGCGQCIRVCPFNKPEGWLHEATRILIGAQSGSLDKLLVNLDDASGYGQAEPSFNFWESDQYLHIKD